jgi:hypothetical protein
VSDLDLFADLVSRKLVTSDGGAVTLPTLVLGDVLRCTLRTMERNEAGDLRERELRVRTLRASIGKVLAQPLVGWFKLWIGDYNTEQINFDANADAFKTAAQGSGIIDVVENPVTGTWVVKTTRPDSGGEWPIHVHSNKLSPESFVRLRQFKQLGVWWFECRLIQAPLSFNNGHERVLGAAPTVRRIRTGDGGSETQPPSNEIQALHLPPDFRGTYFLRWNYRVSRLLGIEDGPDEIAGALNAMFEKGKRFEATNPEPDNAYIEFIGELEGSPQPLITVEVNPFAPGVLTFEMPLDRAQMAAALRAVTEIEVPFEVEAEIVDDGEEIADPAVPGRIITLFQQTVKVVREQIWEELALVQSIDWLRPPQPRDYIPFTPDQIIVGVQHYVCVFGNGESRSYSFPHNLGTEAFHLTVRANAPSGRVLVNGQDFTITIPSANEIVLEFPLTSPPPALNSLALVLSTAGPRSAFLAHTHQMAQVIGLLDALAAITARLEHIEDILPHATPGVLRDKEKTTEIPIPDKAEVFPGRFAAGHAGADAGKLKPGGLLPAIHDATIDNAILPLPMAAAHAGKAFVNNSSADIVLPGGLGRRSSVLKVGGHFGSDGRVWYRLTHDGATNSFFPTDFERELFMLHINEQQLRAGGTFTVEFDIELQLINSITRGQYLFVVEVGSAPGEAAPAPTGTNLQDVTWIATPVLSQRIIVTALKLKHHFGCSFKRSIDGLSIAADRLLYDVWNGGAQPPPTPSFALRARLIQFDTENSISGAKGLVSYKFGDARASITNA